jgi:hypothetical protein
MRARLGRCGREGREKFFSRLNFRLDSLHCIIRGVKTHIDETLADRTEFVQMSKLFRRR